jgi:hypothetical protein
MRSSLATCLHWLSCDTLEAVESVEDVSVFRVVEGVVGNLFSGPVSLSLAAGWLGFSRLCNFLFSRSTEVSTAANDGCAEDILKVSQHKIHLNLDRISLAARGDRRIVSVVRSLYHGISK